MSARPRTMKEQSRFAFGDNWTAFLSLVDDERIREAERSLQTMLNAQSLEGTSFLDIGSGSGLFSLAACRLGARVYSFDCDPTCVSCTRELRRRYWSDHGSWRVEAGSVLDRSYLRQLGRFDVVYAWGVLHHTGAMYRALSNAIAAVKPGGGRLYISIYNYQHYWTGLFTGMKRLYVSSPGPVRRVMLGVSLAAIAGLAFLKDVVTLTPPWRRYRIRVKQRGMSLFYDWIDWIGGYPFETARPEEILDFCRERGLVLARLVTRGGGPGCNEFVFFRP